jgi:hypothetical protein
MNASPHPVPAVPLGGSVSNGGVQCPPAPPLLAESWLLAWDRIGGAVTIGTDRKLTPWFRPETGCRDENAAAALMAQLIETPGLPAAVRIVTAELVRSGKRIAP